MRKLKSVYNHLFSEMFMFVSNNFNSDYNNSMRNKNIDGIQFQLRLCEIIYWTTILLIFVLIEKIVCKAENKYGQKKNLIKLTTRKKLKNQEI